LKGKSKIKRQKSKIKNLAALVPNCRLLPLVAGLIFNFLFLPFDF